MQELRIATARPYNVLIGKGILSDAGQIIKPLGNYNKTAIITDDQVLKLYAKELKDSLTRRNKEVCIFAFPNGERSKNFTVLKEIYSFLISEEITRSDLIIALGGGVVGDMAGFAAATYLRGIDYIQIPTTLISQTDSSVGGKTAVNLDQGKNLMGLFYQPRLVICDVGLIQETFLFREGVGEVIKYGLLADRSLFELLERGEMEERLEEVVARCVEIKGKLVCADERDLNRRQLLNLGHTLGHGVEKISNYRIPHGIAICIGMAIMLSACVHNGLSDPIIYHRLLKVLEQYNLPSTFEEADLKDLVKAAITDKKRLGDDINIVLCKDIGNCIVQRIPIDELYAFLKKSED